MGVSGQNSYKRGEMLRGWKYRNPRSMSCSSEIQCSVRGEIPPEFYLHLDKFDLNRHQAQFKALVEPWRIPESR